MRAKQAAAEADPNAQPGGGDQNQPIDPAIASGTTPACARSQAPKYEVDPDFLEHARREDLVQPELPWDG